MIKSKAVISSIYSTNMIRYVEHQFGNILDEVISGRRKGAVDTFYNQLRQMGNMGNVYMQGLQTGDAIEFNDLLANALIDIAFHTSPAVEV